MTKDPQEYLADSAVMIMFIETFCGKDANFIERTLAVAFGGKNTCSTTALGRMESM